MHLGRSPPPRQRLGMKEKRQEAGRDSGLSMERGDTELCGVTSAVCQEPEQLLFIVTESGGAVPHPCFSSP